MAENYLFFDSQVVDIREYNSSQFSEYFDTIIDTGLIKGDLNQLNPSVTGINMIVTVDTGTSFINGRWYQNDSLLDKTFDTETLGNDRIDLLVLRLDLNTSERKITFEIVKGVPSITPIAPTVTRDSLIYELALVQVFITGGQSFIQVGDITDLREITTAASFFFPTATSKVLSDINTALFPEQTLADITYYVSTTGSDITGDGTIVNPFKTIQFSINKLPQIINHDVTINVEAGTYSESVELEGFFGKGRIDITSIAPASGNIINNVIINNCMLLVQILRMTSTSTIADGFLINRSIGVTLFQCEQTSSSAAYTGIAANSSIVSVNSCILSNRGSAIRTQSGSALYSINNTGTGNTTGLLAISASTIGKSGTQPSGTTAESASGGGVIR